jgi:hypothetical protein
MTTTISFSVPVRCASGGHFHVRASVGARSFDFQIFRKDFEAIPTNEEMESCILTLLKFAIRDAKALDTSTFETKLGLFTVTVSI